MATRTTKQTNKLAKNQNIKNEVEILLQTDMTSTNNGWDSQNTTDMPYFHFRPSSQNKNERKR